MKHDLLELIDTVYEAAFDLKAWPKFLDKLVRSLGAESGILFFEDFRDARLLQSRTVNIDPKRLADYNAHFLSVSPYRRFMEELSAGAVYATDRLLPERTLTRSEFYNDWLRPQSIHFHAGAFLHKDKHRVALVEVQRRKRRGAFGDDELATLEALKPHLRRSFQLSRHLFELQSSAASALDVLERLEVGVVLIREDCSVSHLNTRAERLLRERGLLRGKGRALGAHPPAEEEKLRGLIHEAVQSGRGRGGSAGGWITLRDANGGSPLTVQVSPVRTRGSEFGTAGERICALILIADPQAPRPPAMDSLAALYGFTPGESRLAAVLAEGKSPAEAADELNIAVGTARTVLKRIFEKTGTHRQAELVKLLLSPSAGI